ncbi:FecR domain-containing protein [uncultured Bacteroides sp.]|uniref:FecR family protein n=1 Tax=uncultured Bacteroides sp. TaxID=162156 RepID=UPI002AAAF6DC|nr:FecR domain-containing protein [uncultured Bacteroides sp.]
MRPQITESTLLDFFNGELSTTEEKEILAWREDCDENCRLFDDVRRRHLSMRYAVRAQLIKGNYSSISNQIQKKVIRRTYPLWRWMASAAAVVVIIVSIGLPYYLQDTTSKVSEKLTVSDFGPPARTAILELSDGTCHYIGDEKSQLKEKNGTHLAVSVRELVYQKNKITDKTAKLANEKPIYNKLIIPRGTGQYRVALSDGSVVWLNSDSKLEYPVTFTGGERRVRISGEAYFEVMHDASRPFIVETDHQSVSVLGTKFNVEAYSSEVVRTTLASGRVKVTLAGNSNEVFLSPGEQSVLRPATGSISVHKVSVADVISWKDGVTSLENLTLKQALRVISRSYNVDFDLDIQHSDDIILQGSIPNDENLEVVLSVLSKVADVKFKMSGNGKIRVKEKI